MSLYLDTAREMKIDERDQRISSVPIIAKLDSGDYKSGTLVPETRREEYLSHIKEDDSYEYNSIGDFIEKESRFTHPVEVGIVSNPLENTDRKHRMVKAADVGLEELVWWTEEIDVHGGS